MIWIDGTFYDDTHAQGGAQVGAHDRGLLLGEGLFETCKAQGQNVQFWPQHLDRLMASAAVFGLDVPHSRAAISSVVATLLQACAADEISVIRITLTGGTGGRGLVPAEATRPSLIIQRTKAPSRPNRLTLYMSDIRRAEQALSAQHKTLAYMDNIAARRAALTAGCDEALLRNHAGRIACAAAGNIFVWTGQELITPAREEGALPGIMRGQILAQGVQYGLTVTAGAVAADLHDTPIFVSNSLMGVVPATTNGHEKAPPSDVLAALHQIAATGFAPPRADQT